RGAARRQGHRRRAARVGDDRRAGRHGRRTDGRAVPAQDQFRQRGHRQRDAPGGQPSHEPGAPLDRLLLAPRVALLRPTQPCVPPVHGGSGTGPAGNALATPRAAVRGLSHSRPAGHDALAAHRDHRRGNQPRRDDRAAAQRARLEGPRPDERAGDHRRARQDRPDPHLCALEPDGPAGRRLGRSHRAQPCPRQPHRTDRADVRPGHDLPPVDRREPRRVRYQPMSDRTARLRSLRQEPRGFTVIELLLVVSIIALLVALLLPSMRKAKETALRVKCVARIRQMSAALVTYTADHDIYFPAFPEPLAGGVNHVRHQYGTWIPPMLPYMGLKAPIHPSTGQPLTASQVTGYYPITSLLRTEYFQAMHCPSVVY